LPFSLHGAKLALLAGGAFLQLNQLPHPQPSSLRRQKGCPS
jgi:hypothetical protein